MLINSLFNVMTAAMPAIISDDSACLCVCWRALPQFISAKATMKSKGERKKCKKEGEVKIRKWQGKFAVVSNQTHMGARKLSFVVQSLFVHAGGLLLGWNICKRVCWDTGRLFALPTLAASLDDDDDDEAADGLGRFAADDDDDADDVFPLLDGAAKYGDAVFASLASSAASPSRDDPAAATTAADDEDGKVLLEVAEKKLDADFVVVVVTEFADDDAIVVEDAIAVMVEDKVSTFAARDELELLAELELLLLLAAAAGAEKNVRMLGCFKCG
eukprot:m.110355 g.110355  ORF g.110355 m.110355 type:complete len:273 (+) comp15914_c1_seq2:430-1248(+)